MVYYNARGQAMPESAKETGRVAGTAAGNETITAPAGNTSVSGEGGGDLLIGSSGDNRHWITHPNDRVQEQPGGGIDTQIGWTSIKLAPNVENLIVNGAFNYAVGNDLGNLIIVDNATHWIYGAGGDDVLVGATTERCTFVVRAGEGSDVIYNWNGNSQLQLWGYGFNTAAEIRGAMSQQGNDVVLRFNNGETLTFRDETLASFQDFQFLLPLDRSKLGAITFEDEFDTLQIYDPSLQTGIWRADFGGNLKDEWAYTLTSNGERQVYTKAGWYGQGEKDLGYTPHTVSGGVLTIKAERLQQDQRDAAWGREYSSGMLNTMGMFEQQYGYFEMKALLPTALGAWPAFWMMPTPYVAQTEADIMEGLAATPHVDYRRAWGGDQNLYDNAYKIDPSGYHTYGMLWTPTTVTFYYDGMAVMQAATPANWTHPMALIVNMAVGGWGGEPNELMFPAEMKIDYVKAYALASGETVIERGEPEPPAATLRASGGATSGQTNVPVAFEGNGQAVSTAKIAVHDAKPATFPQEKTFVIWEDSGAVFGAVASGGKLGTATPLMAGDSRVFTGGGTWLSDGKVALAYMQPSGAGQAAWVMVFDPSKNTFIRHELGPSTGDIDIVATKNGGFVASWDAPGGGVMGRGYDAFAYDGEGWFGPARQLAGDVTGVTAAGKIITTNASGQQQLYDMINPPRGVDAIVSIGPMAGVSHTEGVSGGTLYTFTVTRDWDQSEKVTVGWQVRGQGGAPADALDFVGNALPSGTVTFEINQTTAYIQIYVQGDTYQEPDEEFLVTLVNPVGAKLGQATATGFIINDDTGGQPPPAGQTQLSFATSTVTLAEGNSGSTAFSFTVNRTGPTTSTSTVTWSVSGADAADFTGGARPGGTLTFSPGETSKVITVNVAGDTTVEPDETFTVTLSNPSGATLGQATATGVITNDDGATQPPPGGSGQVINSPGPGSTLTGTSGADTINASQGSDVITGGAGADVFAWAKEPWSPARITDFALGSDKLDFSKLFQASGYTGADPVADRYITFLDDGAGGTKVLFDRDGTASGQQWPNYILQLEKVPVAGLTWAKLTTGGGTSEPPPPTSPQITLTTTSLTLAEGNSGTTAFSYTVTRTGSTAGTSSVNWSVAGSGANPATAADFAGAISGTLTFAAGETTKTIVVQAIGDTTVEPDETFTLTLSNPSGATLGQATATGVITNDDGATQPPPGGSGQVINSPGPGSTLTGTSGADTINASQGSDVITGGAGADVFAWAKEPWSPARITDFALGSDKLDFSKLFQASGYTGADPVADRYITFLDDGAGGTKVLFDRDGTASGQQWPNYILQLEKVPVAGLTWAKLTTGGGTSEPPPPTSPQITLTTTSLTLAEGNSGTTAFSYTVTRTGSTAGTSSVNWSVAGSGANPATAADFAGAISGTLTFAAGETTKTIVVQAIGDTTVEPDETFTLTLSNPSGATLGQATATGVITNDDGATQPPPGGSGQVINSPGPGSTLTGTSGADTINASQGSDVITGGAGADRFVFAKEPWSPARITDFERGVDKIDLRGLFDAVGYTGTDPFGAGYMKLIDDGRRRHKGAVRP
ncbi:family 16 glycosylhydrolase [Phenylobacterium sp. J426]|uniref:Calx-beta domain-containing protein n=1 Tax=Phenylobacterium sp. J426 TaxID=2898439 RepID=UPI002151D449|nr:Calx-beta domain-containing protein [Phenylobacterium sp. J426]MCR5875230.1 family 16 glycosylhydrolase [Phenylobacterium sp. J426]